MNASIHVIHRVALSFGAVALLASVHPVRADEAHHTAVAGPAVQWGAAPPSLPAGAQAAVLLGSPAKEGPFVLRSKFPAGFVIPPHRHTKDEMVTVIAGHFQIGAGEKIERASLQDLPAASFVHLPAGMPHYARADRAGTIVQINGVGPFDITYVDPRDDPRKQ